MTIEQFQTNLNAACPVHFLYGYNDEINKANFEFPLIRFYPEEWNVVRAEKFLLSGAKIYVYCVGGSRYEAWDQALTYWSAFKAALSASGLIVPVSNNEPVELFEKGQAVKNVYCIKVITDLMIFC